MPTSPRRPSPADEARPARRPARVLADLAVGTAMIAGGLLTTVVSVFLTVDRRGWATRADGGEIERLDARAERLVKGGWRRATVGRDRRS